VAIRSFSCGGYTMSDVAKFLAGTVAPPPKQAGACEVVILKVRSTSIYGLEFSVWPVDF